MEFLPLGSCWAGASINDRTVDGRVGRQSTAHAESRAAELAASPLPVKRAGKGPASPRNSGRSTHVKPARWKPTLSVVTEDGVVSDIGSKPDKGMVRSQKKAPGKAKSRGRSDAAFLGRLHVLDNLLKWRKVLIGIETPASAELSERYAHIYL